MLLQERVFKKSLVEILGMGAVENDDTGQDHPSKEYVELLEEKATCRLRSTVSPPMRIGETHVGCKGRFFISFQTLPRTGFLILCDDDMSSFLLRSLNIF